MQIKEDTGYFIPLHENSIYNYTSTLYAHPTGDQEVAGGG